MNEGGRTGAVGCCCECRALEETRSARRSLPTLELVGVGDRPGGGVGGGLGDMDVW